LHGRTDLVKILLCDDHGILRDALRALLGGRGFHVVADAASGEQALLLARELRPDLVLLDVVLGGANGIVITRRLLEALPATHVLGLSMLEDHRYAAAMLEAGAMGYVVKSALADELVHAIELVAAGGQYVSPGAQPPGAAGGGRRSQVARVTAARFAAKPALAASRPEVLSRREREVLKLVADGESSKRIAASLEIAVTTVETHRRQIMDKLGLRSVAELTKYAIRAGLTSLD
jgi:DNA-binding NarL/FixJ family response regulator